MVQKVRVFTGSNEKLAVVLVVTGRGFVELVSVID